MHLSYSTTFSLLLLLGWAFLASCGNGRELLTNKYKYEGRSDVLRGSATSLRETAHFSPLPVYPEPSRIAGKGGLVVIEIVVAPDGIVRETNILETFDSHASEEVTRTVQMWRFLSNETLIASNMIPPCQQCVRINRLAFDFRFEQINPYVVDLAMDELHCRKLIDSAN